ncbi:hypothetical protein ACFQDN_03435 [Pseudomonas asuensis]|uniref:Lipoprotein n=1 Tax=Pseudomonas asuensis TaxID=1825787 RepID=A0ABQ2GYR9_9PSED|nr:hypothetical protein [Pseudomonas asuensis]GGM20474.1 lipoprotein [Pseudomonas asuensis]
MKKIILLLLLSTLTSCSWVGTFIKEGAISSVSYSSSKHFDLTGKIPENYSFQTTAYYQQSEPATCTFYSVGVGGYVPRTHIEQHRAEYKDKPQDFSYRIPLSYHEAGCEMKLVNVDLIVFAKYSPKDGDFGRDGGRIGIYTNLPETAKHFPASGRLNLKGKCMWLFRLMGKNDVFTKGLVCHGADENWQVPDDYDKRNGVGTSVRRDELDGKTINVEFQNSKEERPYFRGTWLKTESGWKPCIRTSKYAQCQTPPTFRKFRMDGRECTVYPNCTE